MTRNVSFLVIGGSTAQSCDSKVKVAGRCLDDPIFVGDHFREAQEGEEVKSVNLIVEKISAYGKLLRQLDPVVTVWVTKDALAMRPAGTSGAVLSTETEHGGFWASATFPTAGFELKEMWLSGATGLLN